MTAASPEATPAPPAPLASSTALVLVAAALVAAALVALGLGGLVTVDDVVASSGRSSDRGLAAVPADAAPAPGLAGVAPAVAFAREGDGLPPGLLGEWEELVGEWSVQGGQALVAPDARAGGLAVVAPPDGATTVQVTVAVPRPGAGVVRDHLGADDRLELVIASSGRAVELRRVQPDGPTIVLGSAPLTAIDEPIVLALRRDGDRVEAIANGVLVISRIDRSRAADGQVGLVAGPGRAGEAARFDDLVVA